jgi:hypothetical protein
VNNNVFFSLFTLFFFNAMNADITLRFEGRDAHEKAKINAWLAIQKKCPQAIIASIGLQPLDMLLSSQDFAQLKEGVDVIIPGKFIEHCPFSILSIDNLNGVFQLRDDHVYVVRLNYVGGNKENNENLKNFSPKNRVKQTEFCVQEIRQ